MLTHIFCEYDCWWMNTDRIVKIATDEQWHWKGACSTSQQCTVQLGLGEQRMCMPAARDVQIIMLFLHHFIETSPTMMRLWSTFMVQCQECGIVSMPEVENLYKGVGFWWREWCSDIQIQKKKDIHMWKSQPEIPRRAHWRAARRKRVLLTATGRVTGT